MSRFVRRLLAVLNVRRARLLVSGLFLESYYLARNPDVAAAHVDAALHYVRFGADEGRSPHPLFEPEYYARAAGVRGLPRRQWLWHFLRIGETRGFSPHPLADLRRLAVGYGAKKPFRGLLKRFARDARPPCNPHPLFDVRYYLDCNPDVAEAKVNSLVHFLCYGVAEGRTPSPYFDAQYYVAQLPRPLPQGMLALQHYVEVGGPLGLSPSPRFNPHAFAKRHSGRSYRGVDLLSACLEMHGGKVPEEFSLLPRSESGDGEGINACYTGKIASGARRRVLIVAHTAGDVLFGAERSYLDMVMGATAAGYAVFAVLPRVAPRYLEALLPHCAEVAVLEYGWWRGAKSADEAAVSAFRRYIAKRRIDLVHSNTIMLREPLIAARSEGRPALIHVREIIEHDPDLLTVIGEPAKAIAETVCALADVVVANSRAAAGSYPQERVRLLQNCVDIKRFALEPRSADGTVRFGLLSSNIPKKGLGGFVALAKACNGRVPNARFVAIGPLTEYVRALQAELHKEGLIEAVEFPGYIEDSAAAIGSIDVVVNFSHFAESFGRTVLEGMAAGRPALVYDHGALPELVQDGVNGFVVPYQDWEAAIPIVERLCADAELRSRLGEAGVRTAAQFAFETYAAALNGIYREALAPAPQRPPAQRTESRLPPPDRVLLARRLPARIEPAGLRLAYFLWHFPVPSETFVLNELRYLKEVGIDVRVFCRHSPHPDFKPDFPIEWERVSGREQLSSRLIETGRNMVHAHFVYPTVTDMVWPACTAAGIPFTFIAHAQDIFVHDNDARNRVGEIGQSPGCLRVLALGHFHRQYLIERGVPDEKLMILHQGIDLSLHPLRPGGKPRGSKLVAVQRYVEKKGLDRLIRAAVMLREEGVKVELYGYGPDEEELRKIAFESAAANVAFMGPILNRQELLQALSEADLCVAPSIRAASGDMDGIPTILIEAMAVGVPVLATPLASIPDLVVPGVTGFVAEDAEPATLVGCIREALAAPQAKIDAIIHAARQRVEQRFNTHRQIPALLRLWCGRMIDIVIVSWNNLPELREVIARVFRFTRMPFHLIVCDNASEPDVREFLYALHLERDNVTIIDRGLNSFVGPGTNCAIDHGNSEYIVYLCGKEGFIVGHGWERAVVDYMDAHPEVGLAGTLGYSPTYLRGADYPKAIELFDRFRNTNFASANPERVFRHVQGGLFAIRRAMYEEIGGFSEDVPHQYTDVEYNYYVESCGWQLGEIPGVLALYNKTRPPLAARLTEDVLAIHPPRLADLPNLDNLVKDKLSLCSICFSFLEKGFTSERSCPRCGSSPAARTLMRALAESTLTYRRLKALVLEPPAGIQRFLADQFQGRQLGYAELLQEIRHAGAINHTSGSLDIAYLGYRNGNGESPSGLTNELARVLAPGGTIFVDHSVVETIQDQRFRRLRKLRYVSRAVDYDWTPLHVFERVE